MDTPDNDSDDVINTDALVEIIRKSILNKDVEVDQGLSDFFSKTPGLQLPSELIGHLQEAFYIHDQLKVSVDIRKTGPPVLGPLVNWFRKQFHQLVIFYVNEVTTRQIKVNFHLIKAAYILGQISAENPLSDLDNQATNTDGK